MPLTTVAEDTLMQPLLPVSVTEYVPAVATLTVFETAPVDQRTSPVPTTDNIADGLPQVNVTEDGVILSDGGAVLLPMVTSVVAVHPLPPVAVIE